MIYNPRNRGNDTTESQKEKNVYCNAHFQYSQCRITGLNRGHSKSTFVKEERGGGGHCKANKNEQGEGGS